MRPPAVVLTLLLLTVSPLPAPAAEPSGEETPVDERIRRALELRTELAELLDGLPPEAREEVERRWRELEEAATPPAPDAAAEARGAGFESPSEPAPAPVPEPAEAPMAPPEPAPATSGHEPPAAPPPTAERAGETCDTLVLFDSNGDGFLSGSDRYWRIFHLWRDDGDGRIEESELESLFDAGIRRISARLRGYDSRKGASGDTWIDDAVRLDLPTARQAAILVIDAGKLHRGGELRLVEATGGRLDGFQALRGGLVLESADGRRSRLLCR